MALPLKKRRQSLLFVFQCRALERVIAELIEISKLPAKDVFKAIQSLERRCLIETEEQQQQTYFKISPLLGQLVLSNN